jgi:hypothetical protein
MKLFAILKSKYCWMVLILSIWLGYVLVIKNISQSISVSATILSLLFLLLFAFSNACLIRSIKDRVRENIPYKRNIVINILGSIFGIGAIQSCMLGGMCGVNVGMTILSTILPAHLAQLFIANNILILALSDLLLFSSLFSLRCIRFPR